MSPRSPGGLRHADFATFQFHETRGCVAPMEEVVLSGLTRRAFLSTTAALAGAFALPSDLLGKALAAPAKPSTAPSTLLQTITQSTVANNQYRKLLSGPGEPYLTRIDITGKQPSATRAKTRRSLAYLGHLSDIHIIDAQSPGRLEPLVAVSESFVDATRPHDTMTVQVLAQMVASMNNARVSPVTGAPLTAVLNTGDFADSRNSNELSWYVRALDGGTVTPNSGSAGTYEGVQIWSEATYAYHPDDPAGDQFGERGFPTIPGVLNAAVSQQVTSRGLSAPWYSVYGNHDTLFMGNIQVQVALQAWATGSRKAALWPATTTNMVNWWSQNNSMFQQFVQELRTSVGLQNGVHSVTADASRKLFDQRQFIQAHLDSGPFPGPVGHGFTQASLDNNQTWWQADITGGLRVFGLDTCNQVAGADGAVPQDQFDWLEAGLEQARKDDKLAVVCSHHNSYTLENIATTAIGPSQNLIHADEFVAMLQKYPNMIAWINGHTHINTITAHPSGDGAGFWEITTASCVDYPQQQQMLEVVDNDDGTLSIFTTVLDHDSSAAWANGDFSQEGLASLSRELASNSWAFQPLPRTGSQLDRNTELVLNAPFKLSGISTAQLEKEQAVARARLTAHDQRAPR